MTETQATSGAAGASTNPVDKETKGAPPGGHAAVGRATVPVTEPASPKSTKTDSDESSPARPAGDSAERRPRGSGQAGPPGSGEAAPSGSSQPAAAASGGAGGQASEGPAARQPDDRRAEEPDGKPLPGRPTAGMPGGLAGSRAPLPGASVRYTRAPGMAAPPDGPSGDGRSTEAERPSGAVSATATVPPPTAAVRLAPMPDAPAVPLTSKPGGAGTGGRGVATLPSGRSVGAARVAEAVRGARSISSAAAARGPRRARLVLKRVDPWSVMKFSFAVSLVLFIVTIVATSVLYLALDAMGVFDSVNASLGDLLSSAATTESGGGGFKITAGGVIGTAALLGLINVVLVTALATLGAFIYNVCADLVGGVEMTLSERE